MSIKTACIWCRDEPFCTARQQIEAMRASAKSAGTVERMVVGCYLMDGVFGNCGIGFVEGEDMNEQNGTDPHNYGLVALTKIEAHEAMCTVRYEQIGDNIASLFRLLWASAGTLIVVQVGAIGTLLYFVITHGSGK